MAKIKYDVTDVDDQGGFEPAPVGMYGAKIAEVEVGKSKAGQPMLTVVLELTKDGKGKKLKKSYGRIWHRVPLDDANSGWTWRLLELVKALGLKKKGSLDPDKLVGQEVQVKLRSGKDLDDNYRPEVGRVLSTDEPEDDEPEDDDEPDEDEDEDEDEDDDDDDDEDEEDDDEEEDEDEDEDEEEDEDEDEDYSDLTRNQLIKEARSRGIKVTKKMDEDDIIAALKEDDGEDEDEEEEEEEDEEEEQDYSDWSKADLTAELKERGLKQTGTKDAMVKRLEKDDESEDEPF